MVAIPNPKCYIMRMGNRLKKIARFLNLVLIGARLARAILQIYKLHTCKDRHSAIHYRASRPKNVTNVTGSPR